MAPKQTRRRSMIHAITNIFNSGSSGPSDSPSRAIGTSPPKSDENALERTKSVSERVERESDLSKQSQDLLFHYQLEQPDPRRLGPEAFHSVGVAPNRAVSARIYGVLQRHNIISSHAEDYKVYVDRITRQLPGQLPMLSPAELHRMVGMLFYWEQEQVRWNLIEGQISNLKANFEREVPSARHSGEEAVLEGEEGQMEEGASTTTGTDVPSGLARMSSSYEQQARVERHKLALAHLESSKRMLPSLRETMSQDGAVDQAANPPAYGDFHNSVPVISSPSREDVSFDESVRRTGRSSGPRTGNEEAHSSRLPVRASTEEKSGSGLSS